MLGMYTAAGICIDEAAWILGIYEAESMGIRLHRYIKGAQA